jgi:ATP-dependent Clp protease ATP-binding subunit ClpA
MSKWMHNFITALEHKEVIILFGNVRDKYINIENKTVYSNLTDLLQNLAREHPLSFSRNIFYDVLGKERISSLNQTNKTPNKSDDLSATSPPPVSAQKAEAPTILARWIRELSATRDNTLATIFYLDKLVSFKQSGLSPDERDILLYLEKIIENITPNNRLIMVTLQDTMIPTELYTNSPKVTLIPISIPDKEDRLAYLQHKLNKENPNIDIVANLTDGLFLKDLDNIVKTLEQNNNMGTAEIRVIINKYRIGEQQDYWGSLDIEKLNTASKWFIEEEGVKGQDDAVRKVVEIMTLARAGLSGMASGTLSKPKGVLFFAGPTGVGKTFIAKKLAKFLFSSEEAFVRFDMSEFKEEHTVSKLIGSPPGYVGYERGGILTGAVREKPFSVVLFDEIEKAHPKIMDIFLQILDEGRLTDSRGQTIFFSETVIVFTSNIGTRTQDAQGNSIEDKERNKIDLIIKDEKLSSEKRQELIHQHFTGAVSDFFMFEISRPELLNRIGDNIIPFNYIDNSEMQRKIIHSHLSRIKSDFEEKFKNLGYKLEFSDSINDYFINKYSKVISNFGGRAITNAIEDETMKPLAKGLLRAEYNGLKNLTFKIKDENGKILVMS